MFRALESVHIGVSEERLTKCTDTGGRGFAPFIVVQEVVVKAR
jgi:hypothetical protein